MEFYKLDVNSDYLFNELDESYLDQTTLLLNSEWPRSYTERSNSLKLSYENKDSHYHLPVSLILILKQKNLVIGHVSLQLIEILNLNIENPNVYLQSLVLRKDYRGKGLGKLILNLCEQYLIDYLKQNQTFYKFNEIYLNTKDQQKFYEACSYVKIEPIVFNTNSRNLKFNSIIKNLLSSSSNKMLSNSSDNNNDNNICTWYKKKFIY